MCGGTWHGRKAAFATVGEDDVKKPSAVNKKGSSATQVLDDIATNTIDYLHHQFLFLLSSKGDSLMAANHRNIWEEWARNNHVRHPNDLAGLSDVFSVNFHIMQQDMHLKGLGSIARLVKQLDRKETARVMPSGEQQQPPMFLTSDTFMDNNPFILSQVLPAAFGVTYEYWITIDGDTSVLLSFKAPRLRWCN